MTPEQIISEQFPTIEQQMRNENIPQVVIDNFKYNYEKVVRGDTGYIDKTMLTPITALPKYAEMKGYEKLGEENISKLAIIKLNGGLGTGMGLDKAKTLLPAKDGNTFLDIIINQTLYLQKKYNCAVPLIFMNSFRTEQDTLDAIKKFPEFENGQNGIPATFVQNKVPKINADDFSAAKYPLNPSLEWCPPGHGDIFPSLVHTGLLDTLISKGYEYIFVSNGDNLSSVFSPRILGFCLEKKIPWVSEATKKTITDRKGGHLAFLKNGAMILRESAQCPPSEMDDFLDIEKYKFSNINCLWIGLKALKTALTKNDNILELSLIRNEKTINPSDKTSQKVYQLETAMGAAISCIPEATAIIVPRSRFAPVKNTGGLLSLWSDNYYLDETWTLRHNRNRPEPDINLDPKYYGLMNDFIKHFPNGAPSLIDCNSLTVKGEFIFGKDIVIKGDVILENPTGEVKIIPDGSILS